MLYFLGYNVPYCICLWHETAEYSPAWLEMQDLIIGTFEDEMDRHKINHLTCDVLHIYVYIISIIK